MVGFMWAGGVYPPPMTRGSRICHLGVDIGTTSIRAALFDAREGDLLAEEIEPLPVSVTGVRHELDFELAWTSVLRALGRLNAGGSWVPGDGESREGREHVTTLGVSATASTVAALDGDLVPLGPGLLWADHRASAEAAAIRDTRHPVLARNLGHVSPEWGLPKLMYIWRTSARQPRARSHPRPAHVVELLDWVNFKLCGELVANDGIREWGWCVDDDGRLPADLVERLGVQEPMRHVPHVSLRTGSAIGPVRQELVADCPMLDGARVVMGGMDSYMAALGQGVLKEGRLAASLGSSSSLVAGVDVGNCAGELFGPMRRILPGSRAGYWHGGQSTAGLAVDWVRRLFDADQRDLEAAAEKVPPGSDGLTFRETLLDRRTPAPEAGLRGVWSGLSLFHGPGHLYRSVLEGVAFGARAAAGSLRPSEIVVTGGLVESRLFMEILATAFERPVGVLRHARSAAFGAAFAGEPDRPILLNPVVRWIEPHPGRNAAARGRYAALHRLPRSVGGEVPAA
jgi:sugar (pentulose or hexulose) kinase